MTPLLKNVDVVLGIDWLTRWNPVIDWASQEISIYDGQTWHSVFGQAMDMDTQCGTVKELHSYSGDYSNFDCSILESPAFWEYAPVTAEWKQLTPQGGRNCTIQNFVNSLHSSTSVDQRPVTSETITEEPVQEQAQRSKRIIQRHTATGTIHRKRISREAAQHQLLTPKQMAKVIRRERQCYLAMVLPNKANERHGMTEAVKRARMKETGPKKIPPLKETRRAKIANVPAHVRSDFEQLLVEYEDLFPEALPKGRPPKRDVEFEINLQPGTQAPSRPPYRLSQNEQEELQKQIDDLLAQGHIRPSCSPYGAPILFVPKKDGRWRMCVDYRALNKATIKDKFPLPRIDDLLDRLTKAKYFTALDLASGYHQIAMREDDIPKTAFRTHRGHYEFVVMPFGVANAPATFQRLMNRVFEKELDRFILVYLDDILVHSSTAEEHLQHIREALERLRGAQLYTRLHKCDFFQQELEYLGYTVSAQGIKPSPSKVKAIVEWPEPKTVHDVRSFLGLCGFYRRFVRQYSLKARYLTDLTKAKTQWTWKDDQQGEAFRQLKKSMITAPVLRLPDLDREFVVTTDASNVAVGAVLEQDFGRGLQPVAFESRKLTPAEIRMSAYERELIGIVYAVGKWRHYLQGRHAIIRTDHDSLRHLPNQPSVNRRLWKWISLLQGYDFEVKHIPGKRNPADPLTRQHQVEDAEQNRQVQHVDQEFSEKIRVSEEATDEEIQQKLKELYQERGEEQTKEMMKNIQKHDKEEQSAILMASSGISLQSDFRKLIMDQMEQDDDYRDLIQRLKDAQQPNEITKGDIKYRLKHDGLVMHHSKQNESYSYWRIVVPNEEGIKIQILKQIHCVPYSGHPGYIKTLEQVRQQFWWDNMTSDVRDFVIACPVCQTEKSSHLREGGQLQPLEIPQRKWDHVVLDYVVGMPKDEEKYNAILSVIDKATKMCHFIPCWDKITAAEIAKLYWAHVGRLHGIPSVIISDRDPKFTSKFWRELWRIMGTSLRMGSGYHPQSSGQVERLNQHLEQTLRCTMHQLGAHAIAWREILPTVEFSINNTPSRVTGYSPFYLNYGYHPLSPAQMLGRDNETSNEAVTVFIQRLQKVMTSALDQLHRSNEQMRTQADKKRRSLEFQVNEMVLLNTRYLHFKDIPRKLHNRFEATFKLLQKISPEAYGLD